MKHQADARQRLSPHGRAVVAVAVQHQQRRQQGAQCPVLHAVQHGLNSELGKRTRDAGHQHRNLLRGHAQGTGQHRSGHQPGVQPRKTIVALHNALQQPPRRAVHAAAPRRLKAVGAACAFHNGQARCQQGWKAVQHASKLQGRVRRKAQQQPQRGHSHGHARRQPRRGLRLHGAHTCVPGAVVAWLHQVRRQGCGLQQSTRRACFRVSASGTGAVVSLQCVAQHSHCLVEHGPKRARRRLGVPQQRFKRQHGLQDGNGKKPQAAVARELRKTNGRQAASMGSDGSSSSSRKPTHAVHGNTQKLVHSTRVLGKLSLTQRENKVPRTFTRPKAKRGHIASNSHAHVTCTLPVSSLITALSSSGSTTVCSAASLGSASATCFKLCCSFSSAAHF